MGVVKMDGFAPNNDQPTVFGAVPGKPPLPLFRLHRLRRRRRLRRKLRRWRPNDLKWEHIDHEVWGEVMRVQPGANLIQFLRAF